MVRSCIVAGVSYLALGISSALAAGAEPSGSLSEQARLMPADFRAHFFNAPVSARVMLDGRLLGDAIIILYENNRAQLVSFTDSAESEYGEAERQRWLSALAQPVPLGTCSGECPAGVLALDYNLNNAQLGIHSTAAKAAGTDLWHDLPKASGVGFLLSNQLNLTGGQQQPGAMSWSGGLEAGLGQWTAVSEFQMSHSNEDEVNSQHAARSLYLLHEGKQNFVRGGLFMPDSQGVLRQPYTRRGGITTLAGVMAGSSDTLMKEGNFPSLYPLWVTANREGVAEIYRDGVLINSQPVTPGLQTLDTTPLPVGIYEVEIRIIEDGREAGRTTETVSKSAAWRNPQQRLRYNLFAGRQSGLWNSERNDSEGEIAAGGSINYLLHPTLTGGAALQKTAREHQAGVSLDWMAGKQYQLYGNLSHSSVTGNGFDAQAMWLHDQGNVALTHSRSWYRQEERRGRFISSGGRLLSEQSTALSTTYRLNSDNSLNSRLSHSSVRGGIGLDAGYSTRNHIAGTPVNWRLAAFDRPYNNEGRLRNRGVNLTASFYLGNSGRSASASIGSRTDSRSGARDLYASASVNQEWQNGFIKSSSATVTGDRHGAGLSTYNHFDMPVAAGSFWGQSSSLDRHLSGGANLSSTLAFGQGKAVLSRQPLHHQGGGLIVDVASDDRNAGLIAHHEAGSTPLKPGRNFIPVSAWKPGSVQLDFPGSEAPALKVWPQYLDYHHVRGGVSTHEVRVMKTVTVMGRLTDAQGQPLGGAHVINHAGRTVSEADGIFTLELHETNPVMAVKHASGTTCDVRLDPAVKQKGEIIFAGNLLCDGANLTKDYLARSEEGS